MNRFELRIQRMLTALVVVTFAAFWGLMWLSSGPPEFTQQYFMSAIFLSIICFPWVLAVRLLWRVWCRAQSVDLAAMDGPTRVLTIATGVLPKERCAWGEAMLAELAAVPARGGRWRFALGCASTAVLSPLHNRTPAVWCAILCLAATACAVALVRQAMPALTFFSAAFFGLLGGLATLTVARTRRIRDSLPGVVFPIIAALGVAACLGLTVFFLKWNVDAAEHLTLRLELTLAVVLAACLWLALVPPMALATNNLARGVAIGTALVLAIGFFVTSRLTIYTTGGPLIWLFLAPQVVCFSAAAMAAWWGRSFAAGAQSTAWSILLATLFIYPVWLWETMHRFALDGCTLMDGERGHPIGVNLADAIDWMFLLPLLGLPMGIIGAAAGAALHRRKSLGAESLAR